MSAFRIAKQHSFRHADLLLKAYPLLLADVDQAVTAAARPDATVRHTGSAPRAGLPAREVNRVLKAELAVTGRWVFEVTVDDGAVHGHPAPEGARSTGFDFALDPGNTGLLVLGEVQFGNWGLLFRDLLRLVDTQTRAEVDLYIYVTATGSLSTAISASTVNYDQALTEINTFRTVLSPAIWLVGVDLAEDDPPPAKPIESPQPRR